MLLVLLNVSHKPAKKFKKLPCKTKWLLFLGKLCKEHLFSETTRINNLWYSYRFQELSGTLQMSRTLMACSSIVKYYQSFVKFMMTNDLIRIKNLYWMSLDCYLRFLLILHVLNKWYKLRKPQFFLVQCSNTKKTQLS